MNKIINNYFLVLITITLLLPNFGFAQHHTQVVKQTVKGWNVETGYFANGQPYAKAGNGDKVLVQIEALSFDHSPPEGFLLKLFVQQSQAFYEEYTVYRIGRKANLPDGYSIDEMSQDYGRLIESEFDTKVNVSGESTGGQIGLCLAANFPDSVNKVVIISAAHRLSNEGKELELKAAQYFAQEKYGKTMATLIEAVYDKGIKRMFYKALMRLAGRSMLKDVQYPNDFQVAVLADCNMEFEERLSEIKAPTLIIAGAKDIGYTIDDVKRTAAGIENSKLLIYDKYGHDLYSDNYKEVNVKINGFLN